MDKYIFADTDSVYIGDPCYELEDDLYDGVWGKKHYNNGVIRSDIGVVHGTYYGDGCYEGKKYLYGVDSGCLAILDGNKCEKDESSIYGHFFKVKKGLHELRLMYNPKNGVFEFLIDGRVVETVRTK